MAAEGLVSTSWWLHGPKRVFDVVATSLIVLVLSPLLLIAAGLVKATSRGPVFFVQERGGREGRPFAVYKFRTMSGTRKPDPKELVPLDHPEITPVGKWLRRFKIDELPQLFNVLKGDMSLVGPRPTLMDQIEAYDDFQRQRLLLRPGITGLAQTHGSAMMSWDERILYDVAYVRRCSLLLDLYILIRTVAVVILGEKAMTRPFAKTRYASVIQGGRSGQDAIPSESTWPKNGD